MLLHTNDHNDVLTDSLEDLSSYIKTDDLNPFACPGSGAEYVLVRGLTLDMPRDMVLVFCPEKHRIYDVEKDRTSDSSGLNILFLDSSVHTIELNNAKDMFSEQGIEYNQFE